MGSDADRSGPRRRRIARGENFIARFLYGVTATDAPTFVVMLLLFAAVAFLATYIPARRAASIDPTVAFWCE